MQYLSSVPLIVVIAALVLLVAVQVWRIVANEPGPIVSYELTMAERAIRRFNKRMDSMAKRFDHE